MLLKVLAHLQHRITNILDQHVQDFLLCAEITKGHQDKQVSVILEERRRQHTLFAELRNYVISYGTNLQKLRFTKACILQTFTNSNNKNNNDIIE